MEIFDKFRIGDRKLKTSKGLRVMVKDVRTETLLRKLNSIEGLEINLLNCEGVLSYWIKGKDGKELKRESLVPLNTEVNDAWRLELVRLDFRGRVYEPDGLFEDGYLELSLSNADYSGTVVSWGLDVELSYKGHRQLMPVFERVRDGLEAMPQDPKRYFL